MLMSTHRIGRVDRVGSLQSVVGGCIEEERKTWSKRKQNAVNPRIANVTNAHAHLNNFPMHTKQYRLCAQCMRACNRATACTYMQAYRSSTVMREALQVRVGGCHKGAIPKSITRINFPHCMYCKLPIHAESGYSDLNNAREN